MLAGGQVVFLGDIPFLPDLTIDSAQNEWNNKTQIKKKKKRREIIQNEISCFITGSWMSLKIGEKSTFVMSFSPYQWVTLTCFVWVVYQINLQIQKKNQMFALNQFSKHYYNFSHLDFDNYWALCWNDRPDFFALIHYIHWFYFFLFEF